MAKTSTGKTNGRTAAGRTAAEPQVIELGSDGRPLPPPRRGERQRSPAPSNGAAAHGPDGRMGSGILMGTVTASQSDVTDELERGGPAFGSFVKSIGEAVAAAQTQLDANLAATAKKLSETNVDVIAVYEQQIDDNGALVSGTPVKMSLPLINYLMPTAYQWTRVFLQADLNVSEFNGANGFNIQGQSRSYSARAAAGYSMFGFGASGSASYAGGSYSQSVETSVSRDSAAGKLHLQATLEPRADIELPKPHVLQKGPRLKLVVGSRSDITTGNPPQVTGRQATVTANVVGSSGPLEGKLLEIKVSDPSVDYETVPTTGRTDATGTLQIRLKRQGAAYDASTPPQPVLVRVWFGLVAQEIGLSI